MKKIFTVLFVLLSFSSILSAKCFDEFVEEVKSLIPEYYQILKSTHESPDQRDNPLNYTMQTHEGSYTTTEQKEWIFLEAETEEWHVDDIAIAKPETSITEGYKEVTIPVPEGYYLGKNMEIITRANRVPQIYFPSIYDRTIMIMRDGEDISFKLDYEVIFRNKEDYYQEDIYGYFKVPMDFKIKYSPKYFNIEHFYQDENHTYNSDRKVTVQYKGKTVNFNAIVSPILGIRTPTNDVILYILEPNFQNIYNDFTFVREGHKDVYFR